MDTVLLSITEGGLAAARRLAEATGASVWCDSRAISADEFSNVPLGTLTRFVHAIDDDKRLADALDTIGTPS